MKEINLEEISFKHMIRYNNIEELCMQEMIVDACREACEKTIELCAENANIKIQFISTGDYSGYEKNSVDKNSILNTKNQIK